MIEPEVAALFEGPSALVVGTADAAATPAAVRAWGVEVLGDAQMRILLAADASVTLANVAANGAIAVTATDVMTNQSIQVKGRAGTAEPVSDADLARHAAYLDGFFRVVHESDGTAYELMERLRPGPQVALVVSVETVFDQTPGPAAGRSLLRTGA
jgi:predicted pyridoxine 5'-phosphate oxidase superfamily flavin-nucleotide-binding protein